MSAAEFLVGLVTWVLFSLAAISVVLFALSCRYRELQERMLYYPNEPPDSTTVCATPAEHDIRYSEPLSITTADGMVLRGYTVWPGPPPPLPSDPPAASASQPVSFFLIYFHGNAGNVGHRLPIAKMLAEELRCGVMMVDYRGYGLSTAVAPTQEGLLRDAEACLDHAWADPRVPRERIVVMGTSLGGAVVTHLAAKPSNRARLAAAVLENTFTSISDMTTVMGRPLIHHLAGPTCAPLANALFECYCKPLLLRIGWRSIRKVPDLKLPLLFLSGQRDELVPPEQMRTLYQEACRTNTQIIRRFVAFPDGAHNNLCTMPGYCQAIKDFVEEVKSASTSDVV